MTEGQFLLDEAEGGSVKTFCLGEMRWNQFISAGDLREMALTEFGNSLTARGRRFPLPSVSSFKTAMARWTEEATCHG